MSRAIKFRAWDKEEKKIYPYPSLNMFDEMWTLERDDFMSTEVSDIILMQYTGLKDKNGKEIYEGDIVTHENYAFRVIFDERYAAFGLVGIDFHPDKHDSFRIPTDNGTEVIGNIYESPELLKEAHDE